MHEGYSNVSRETILTTYYMNDSVRHDKKLGRGLSALLGDNKTKADFHQVQHVGTARHPVIEMLEVARLVAGVYQPRRHFDQAELQELADSIKEHGVLQPIIVRKADGDDEQHYEIIAGERRFRASKMAGLIRIPAIIKKINNHEALELAIIENVQRSDLSLIEEAEGYRQLIHEFSYSQEQVAQKTGKSRSHIANSLRLLTLPHSVHALLEKRLISMGHARAIINSKDPEELARKIVETALTVRETEEMIRDEKIEKIKNSVVSVRTESKVTFVNSAHLVGLENQLAEILGSRVKISYNQFKNSGKISIDFSEFDMLHKLIKKLS